jgi:hypothetical protein
MVTIGVAILCYNINRSRLCHAISAVGFCQAVQAAESGSVAELNLRGAYLIVTKGGTGRVSSRSCDKA